MHFLKTPLIILLTLFTIGVSNAFTVIRNLSFSPKAYTGTIQADSNQIQYDSSKSNVFIVADSKLTELFDMLAPFYLFNLTKKANVFIVARDKTPILIKRDLYVLPQLTFAEADSLNLKAAVIIIPALSIRDEHQDVNLIDWLKSHVSPETKMLAVCDGASTAAATAKEVHLPEHSNTSIITYVENKYPIDICLTRISLQYGHKFENVVRLLLDYN